MAQTAGMCNHAGCYCKGYIVPTSKWSKGKCKSCNHSQSEHGEIVADVTFESKQQAQAPVNPDYAAQIDGNMGIAPSGNTDFKNVGGYGGKKKSKEPSIYSIHLDESDWINWSSDDLLVWFQQKKKFPESLTLKDIKHEMKNGNINGSKITQATHSTLLSYGFTEYDHRSRLLAEIKKLLEKYPNSTQTPKNNSYGTNANAQKNKNDDLEQKQAPKKSKAESELLAEQNLSEAQWKTWDTAQVWEWLKIKQGWSDMEELEYMVVHKINEYETKLKSKEIALSGDKFVEVQNDMKTQTLLKGIGFPFSLRKKVFKDIDTIIRHNPN